MDLNLVELKLTQVKEAGEDTGHPAARPTAASRASGVQPFVPTRTCPPAKCTSGETDTYHSCGPDPKAPVLQLCTLGPERGHARPVCGAPGVWLASVPAQGWSWLLRGLRAGVPSMPSGGLFPALPPVLERLLYLFGDGDSNSHPEASLVSGKLTTRGYSCPDSSLPGLSSQGKQEHGPSDQTLLPTVTALGRCINIHRVHGAANTHEGLNPFSWDLGVDRIASGFNMSACVRALTPIINS